MDIDQRFVGTVKHSTTKRYLGIITLLISLVVASSFLGFTYRTDAMFDKLLLEEGRAFQREVTLIRRWVRGLGGVYIRQDGGKVMPQRQIIDQHGEVLLHRNTSEVTQALSRLSRQSGIVQFGSTSLTPLNAANKPDDFEREGLVRLREGEEEVYAFDMSNGRRVFRYMSPLVTTKQCLKCHTDGSFRQGRVDSGLTFTIPADSIIQEKQTNRLLMALSGGGVIGLISIAIWMLARRFIHQLAEADHQLEKMASEDALTQLFNRRMGMELLKKELALCEHNGHPLSLALLDIDHFKRINDTMGHSVGDEGLRALADIIRSQLREYDIAFRFGGEEFTLILPDTNLSQALVVAERLRSVVEGYQSVTANDEVLVFTLSIGVVQFQTDMGLAGLLDHADEALYVAKNGGRNRVCAHPPNELPAATGEA